MVAILSLLRAKAFCYPAEQHTKQHFINKLLKPISIIALILAFPQSTLADNDRLHSFKNDFFRNYSPRASEVAPSWSSLVKSDSISGSDQSSSHQLIANISGANKTVLKCNEDTSLDLDVGTLVMRNNCRYKTIDWGFTVSPALQGNIISQVNERGMEWFKNGYRMPKNSPHTKYKYQMFHGTFNPVELRNQIYFQDYLDFYFIQNGRRGYGYIVFYGEVYPVEGLSGTKLNFEKIIHTAFYQGLGQWFYF
jgi:hypothetical protein